MKRGLLAEAPGYVRKWVTWPRPADDSACGVAPSPARRRRGAWPTRRRGSPGGATRRRKARGSEIRLLQGAYTTGTSRLLPRPESSGDHQFGYGRRTSDRKGVAAESLA